MTRLSTLTRLRDMVRNADGPDDELAARILAASLAPANAAIEQSRINGAWCIYVPDFRGKPRLWEIPTPWKHERVSPSASLDGSYALAEKALPGCKIALADVGSRHTAHIKYEGLEAAAYGNTRPLAILDCLLSVLIEKEERE